MIGQQTRTSSPARWIKAAERAISEGVQVRQLAGSGRCYVFPDRLEDARKTRTPKGRCKVGWIVSRGGRESWDVWLEVSTGLVKLVAQTNA